MPTFEEWLEKAKEYDSDADSEMPLDTIFSNLESTYTDLRDGSSGIIAQKESTIKEYEGEISRLKSANYDLMMQIPAGDDTDNVDKKPAEQQQGGIDSLFKIERKYR